MIRCFIIGHPIAHSRSPLIHGTWLARHGIDGSYAPVDVAPADLPAFFERIRAGEFAGGNVTLPHKEAILPLLDIVHPTARAMGAANTVWRDEEGRLNGDNTDGYGFVAHLDDVVPGWAARTKTALLLGAGGAARGIAHVLRQRGVARLLITNRSLDRAEELAAEFGDAAQAIAWNDAAARLAEVDLLVNTTSLGMKGQPPLMLHLAGLRAGTIVDDIVYVPLKTALLEEAEKRGAVIVDGLGMLLHQATPGFRRWFGVAPVVDAALRDRIEADLLGR